MIMGMTCFEINIESPVNKGDKEESKSLRTQEEMDIKLVIYRTYFPPTVMQDGKSG